MKYLGFGSKAVLILVLNVHSIHTTYTVSPSSSNASSISAIAYCVQMSFHHQRYISEFVYTELIFKKGKKNISHHPFVPFSSVLLLFFLFFSGTLSL